MTAPRRHQRKREAGWTTPLDEQGRKAVYVGRGSRWGNPFAVVRQADGLYGIPAAVTSGPWPTFDTATEARREAVHLFALHTGVMGMFEYDDDDLAAMRKQLAGRDLTCWCPAPEPGEPDWCHAAYLMDRVNEKAVAR